MIATRRAHNLYTVAKIFAKRQDAREKNKQLITAFIAMGGIYIKFAQLMLLKVSSSEVQDYSFLLKKTYDSAPFEPIELNSLIAEELGPKARMLDIMPTPIAAGSFGQVYRATHITTHEQLIVKIARPSVIKTIGVDLKILGVLARLLHHTRHDGIDILQLFREFKTLMLRELNYETEAHYASELYETYHNHHALVIPKTYSEFCSKHIITQQYIEGLPLTDVLAQTQHTPSACVQQRLESDLAYQLTIIGQEMLTAMLLGRTAHGDPHPGNILLLPENKIALIDFGICTDGPTNKQAFFKLVRQYEKVYTDKQLDIQAFTLAITELFVDELTGAVRALDRLGKGKISDTFFAAVQDAAEDIFSESKEDIESLIDNNKILQIFHTIINENNRFGFQLTIDQPAFIRATLLYISLVESLGLKQEVLQTCYANVVHAFTGHVFSSPSRKPTSPDQALGTIAEWLDTVATHDIVLYTMIRKRLEGSLL